MKILDEKYSKIHEQNKRYSDPFAHITSKYRDPYSPNFRSDLTKSERDAAFTIELSWLRTGEGGYYSTRDAAFRDDTYIDPGQQSINKNIFNRGKVNEQIQVLFSKHGLTIPDKLGLRFTINPNNFNLVVSGSKDDDFIKQIEGILNSDNNARELFFHIMKSRSDKSTQFTKESADKFRLVNQIKTMTGYNLKDLEIADGKFITEDGRDLFEIYKAELCKNPYTANHVGIASSYYGAQLDELAKNGFNTIPDLVLSIDYKDGLLHDLGQRDNYSFMEIVK